MKDFFNFADRHPWYAKALVLGVAYYASNFVVQMTRAITGNYPPAEVHYTTTTTSSTEAIPDEESTSESTN